MKIEENLMIVCADHSQDGSCEDAEVTNEDVKAWLELDKKNKVDFIKCEMCRKVKALFQ